MERTPPLQWSLAHASPFVRIDRDLLTVTYKGKSAHTGDCGCVRAGTPVPPSSSFFYFEVQILDSGSKG
jgi:hypothetical protein